jgi:hypothetical protein
VLSVSARGWVAAGKALAADPEAKVRCPERDDGLLRVEDVPFPNDATLIERHLVCEVCGARNVIRMRASSTG